MKIKSVKAWAVYFDTGEYYGKIRGFRYAFSIYSKKKYAQYTAKENYPKSKFKIIPVLISPIKRKKK